MHCRRAVPAGRGPPSEQEEMDLEAPEEVILDENRRKTEVGRARIGWLLHHRVGPIGPQPVDS